MRIDFCGVGEAFDEALSNTSLLVTTDKAQVLLDCGFTAAHAFWRIAPKPLELDAVWVSHFHGDHFFGLPVLLLRFWEEGRTQPLTVIGPYGVEDLVWTALDLAYEGFRDRLQYPLRFLEAEPGKVILEAGFRWTFAETSHSALNLAVRLDHVSGSLFYSGDGRPTAKSINLMAGCDLALHEAFGLDDGGENHGSVKGCLAVAKEAGVKQLALVHIQREVRRSQKQTIQKMIGQGSVPTMVPEPGESIAVSSPAPGV